jgi:hypothetical protein
VSLITNSMIGVATSNSRFASASPVGNCSAPSKHPAAYSRLYPPSAPASSDTQSSATVIDPIIATPATSRKRPIKRVEFRSKRKRTRRAAVAYAACREPG